MVPTLVRRVMIVPRATFNGATNPYKAKKSWPPDFDKLSHMHQFRYERKYKRRCKLKWARPVWNKSVKLAQWGAISFVLVYGVLFMDWNQERAPFQGIRSWYKDKVDSIWTTASQKPRPPRTEHQATLEAERHTSKDTSRKTA